MSFLNPKMFVPEFKKHFHLSVSWDMHENNDFEMCKTKCKLYMSLCLLYVIAWGRGGGVLGAKLELNGVCVFQWSFPALYPA